jgi:hypothetical protein
MHNIDEILDDLGLNVGKTTKALQWLVPVNPQSYRNVTKKLKKRRVTPEPATVPGEVRELN